MGNIGAVEAGDRAVEADALGAIGMTVELKRGGEGAGWWQSRRQSWPEVGRWQSWRQWALQVQLPQAEAAQDHDRHAEKNEGGPVLSVDESAVFGVGKGGEFVSTGQSAGLAAGLSSMPATRGGQTDSHVHDSNEAGRDGSAVGSEPMDFAQVLPASESVPEVAVANSTTRTSTQLARLVCSGGNQEQVATTRLAQTSGSEQATIPSDRLRSESASAEAAAVTDSLSQRRNELLLELERKARSEHHPSPSSGATASGWNGAAAQAGVGASAETEPLWNGTLPLAGPEGSEQQQPVPTDCEAGDAPDSELLQAHSMPATTVSRLGSVRDPATLKVKLRLANAERGGAERCGCA
jgi:hypothetical protein